MNSPQGQKDRPWRARLSARNGESSATITLGMPVCLKSSDLSMVITPNTATAVEGHSLFAGVAVNQALAGQFVEVVGAGYCAQAKFVHRTRAASTDSWSTVDTNKIGALLQLDTINNAFMSSATGAAIAYAPYAVLCELFSSKAGVASTTSNSLTVSTGYAKVWVRALG